MKIKSVSQNWFRQMDSNLSVKLSVSILDGMDTDSFYNIYETTTYDYLSINISASVVFQYKTTAPYDRSFIAKVSEEDLFQMNKSLQEFYRKLSRTDLFTYYKSGAIECNNRRDDSQVISLRSGEFLEFEPGVVIDKKTNTPLPGVFLYINKKAHKTEITIDEFEFLMYKFSRLDIGADSIRLINTKLLLEQTLLKDGGSESSQKDKSKPQTNISQRSIFDKKVESVIDKRPMKTKQINSLDDL